MLLSVEEVYLGVPKGKKTILLQPNNLGKTGVFVEGGNGAKVFKKISIGRVVGGVFVFAMVRVG